MDARHYVALRLEIETETEPIAGRIAHDDGGSHSFHGWLELAAALEEALRSPLAVEEGTRTSSVTPDPKST